MSLATVVSVGKTTSMIALVIFCNYCAYFYDKRFTMLLVPPFLLQWANGFDENSMVGAIMQIPIFAFARKIFLGMGDWTQKSFLMSAGVFSAYIMFQILSPQAAE